MNRVLSDDEVAALLRGLSGGSIEEEENPNSAVEQKDNKKSTELEEDIFVKRLPQLELFADSFSRKISSKLSQVTGCRIEFNPISVDANLYGQILRGIPVPTAINILDLQPLNGKMLSMLDARLTFVLVERTMGSPTNHQPMIEGREFTQIEHAILDEACNEINEVIRESWSDIVIDLEVSHLSRALQPQFATIADSNEACYIVSFEVELETCLGAYMWVIPCSSLNSILPFLQNSRNPRIMVGSEKKFIVNWLRRYKKQEENNNITPRTDFFATLKQCSDAQVATVLKNEHPQTIACVLSFLDPLVGSQVILSLPYGVRSDVLYRMNHFSDIPTRFLAAVEKTIYNQILKDRINLFDKDKAILFVLKDINPEQYQIVIDEIKNEVPKYFSQRSKKENNS